MFRQLSLVFYLLQLYCPAALSQTSKLNGQYEESTSRVVLDWNMVKHPTKTTYTLLKSADGKNWTEIVTDKYLRNYSEEDLFDYDDRAARNKKYYYQVKITDASKKVIALSNIVAINTEADKRTWVIYPNPVNDFLNLVYEGNNIIEGVINVLVQDMAGKIVIRFRAASIYKKLNIPLSGLRKGVYIVKVSVMNEIMLNQQFVKQ
jgi:hypothetical protein